MKNIQHLLITGDIGVGKSTLVQRLLSHCSQKRQGFYTNRIQRSVDGLYHVYIHDASAPVRNFENTNCIGMCNQAGVMKVYPQVFESVGHQLLDLTNDAVVIMDELGFMETQAEGFCKSVLEVLDGNIPVLAVVKNKQTSFLDAVRTHKNTNLFHVTPENREKLYQLLIPYVSCWKL